MKLRYQIANRLASNLVLHSRVAVNHLQSFLLVSLFSTFVAFTFQSHEALLLNISPPSNYATYSILHYALFYYYGLNTKETVFVNLYLENANSQQLFSVHCMRSPSRIN